MYRGLGKNACDALGPPGIQNNKRLRGDIQYAIGSPMSVRQEPGTGGEELRLLLTHKARHWHQTPKPLDLVSTPLADPDAPEMRKSKN
jgi:hypothetical protein